MIGAEGEFPGVPGAQLNARVFGEAFVEFKTILVRGSFGKQGTAICTEQKGIGNCLLPRRWLLAQSPLERTPFQFEPDTSVGAVEVTVDGIVRRQPQPFLNAVKAFVKEKALPGLAILVDRPQDHRPADAEPIDGSVCRAEIIGQYASPDAVVCFQLALRVGAVGDDSMSGTVDKENRSVKRHTPGTASLGIGGLLQLPKVLPG